MLDASTEFKNNISEGKPFYGESVITLADGTGLTLGANDFIMSNGFSFSNATSSTSTFDIGSVIIGQNKMQIQNFDNRFKDISFEGARAVSYVCSSLIDGKVEKIQKGIFTVVDEQIGSGIISLTAYDSLHKYDTEYTGERDNVTAYNIVLPIIQKHGDTLAKHQFNNKDFVISIPDSKYTDRQILSYVCQITGNYCYVDAYGYIRIEWYDKEMLGNIGRVVDARTFTNPAIDIINSGTFADMTSISAINSSGTLESIKGTTTISTIFGVPTIAKDDVVITGVKVRCSDGTYITSGQDGYVLTIENNPLVNGNEQKIANNIASIVVGMKFRPLSMKTIQNPLIVPGDIGLVMVDGEYNATIFTNVDYSIGSNTSLVCGATSPSKNSSARNTAAATVAEIKSAEITEKRITNYDASMQQLTNLMSMSLGMFETQEKQSDGSVIYYMHNKPELSNSSTIWKKTANAFAVSTDGGKTWNAGIDSQGNAIVNVLSAIGINFDWANGGTLTLGGVSNGNGEMKVVDENGTLKMRANKDGLFAVGVDVSGDVKATSGNVGEWKIDGRKLYGSKMFSDGYVRVTYVQIPEKDDDWVYSVQKANQQGWDYTTLSGEVIIYANGKISTSGDISTQGKISTSGDVSAQGVLMSKGEIALRSDGEYRIRVFSTGIGIYDSNLTHLGSISFN